VQINLIKKNEYVGYDGGYKAKSDNEYIAVIPCGYGDGFPRSFFNGGYVYIKNKKYPIVSKIAMDTFMIKVDKTIKTTDIVEIFKDEKHLSDMINKTMKNDAYFTVLANINNIRVKRVVIK
jgi:alanine racemase